MPAVYLTFDDGPNEGTANVLEALRAEQAKATFFLNLIWLDKDPNQQYRLIKTMLRDRHTLGNHGYDHNPAGRKEYARTPVSDVKQDFVGNAEKLEALFRRFEPPPAAESPSLLRPPPLNVLTQQDKRNRYPKFEIARLPGDGRLLRDFVDMLRIDLKIPHAAWDFEFSTNGTMPHVKVRDWQGVAGVAGEFKDFPKDRYILLLHDRHWAGKKQQLQNLVRRLKEKFSFALLVPVPAGLTKISYPPRA